MFSICIHWVSFMLLDWYTYISLNDNNIRESSFNTTKGGFEENWNSKLEILVAPLARGAVVYEPPTHKIYKFFELPTNFFCNGHLSGSFNFSETHLNIFLPLPCQFKLTFRNGFSWTILSKTFATQIFMFCRKQSICDSQKICYNQRYIKIESNAWWACRVGNQKGVYGWLSCDIYKQTIS